MNGSWLIWVVLAAGCAGDGATTDKDEGDADTDTDSDADADADADADSDADVDVGSLTATATYAVTLEGAPQCERTVQLTGTPYTGDCPDCLFAFDLDTTADDQTGDCFYVSSRYSWADTPPMVDLKLAFVDHYVPDYTYGGYPSEHDQVLMQGYSLDLTAYGGVLYEGPYWAIVGYADAAYQSDVAWDGLSALSSDFAFEYYYFPPSPYLQFCSTYLPSDPLDAAPEVPDLVGEASCDGSTLDVYAFDVPAGGVVELWVDNVADADPDRALNPWFTFTDDAGCSLAYPWYDHLCTVQPPDGSSSAAPPPQPTDTGYYYPPYYYEWNCPSMSVTPATAGTYRVVMQGYGPNCTDTASYALRGTVDGAPITFDVVVEDAPAFSEPQTQAISATLDATVTLAP